MAALSKLFVVAPKKGFLWALAYRQAARDGAKAPVKTKPQAKAKAKRKEEEKGSI